MLCKCFVLAGKWSYKYFNHRHGEHGQLTLNLTALIDVLERPSVRIDERRDGLRPL